MRLSSWAAGALMAVMLAGCGGLYGHDEFAAYTQRSDTMTMSAGDAKAVNTATHANSMWPRGVSDRRIIAEGWRPVRAVKCYREGKQEGTPTTTATTKSSGTADTAGNTPGTATTKTQSGREGGNDC